MHIEEFNTRLLRCEKFQPRHADDRIAEFLELSAEYARTVEPVSFAERLKLKYRAAVAGDTWGGAWDSAWFHITGKLPAAWRKGDIRLDVNFSGEALVFDAEGVPVYGLTGKCAFNVNYTKTMYPVPAKMLKSGSIDIWVEAAGNMLFGVNLEEDPHALTGRNTPSFEGKIQQIRLARIRPEVEAMLRDWEVAFGLLRELPRDGYRARNLLKILSDAQDAYAENPANAAAARAVLKRVFANRAASSAMTATAVGHAHIDTGWLWPVRETIRKCARTYASQLALLEKYPDYVFGASAPQHYAFVKKYYPGLFRKIKKRVAEGRWELQGGMWVEADCNLISGESMVRQFLHGKNFFRDEFGVEVKNLWIPDVFGYSDSMPQIMKKAGCDYFLTQKISWNKINTFPFHSFFWRGIDGTEVLAHFPPENNYNAEVLPRELIPAQDRYNESDVTDGFLSLVGIGDGGGGPAEEYVERAHRCADLEGLPKVGFGRADAFFRHLETFAGNLPTWVGELYLEMHRGTFTSQAHTKRNNRKCEQSLAAVEFLWSAAKVADYPAAELDELWKLLLLNQFHDIIPGSSITRVYETTEQQHADILARCAILAGRAAAKLGRRDSDSVMVCNTLGCPFRHRFELPESFRDCRMEDAAGNELELTFDGEKLWGEAELPAGAFTAFRRQGRKHSALLRRAKALVLENERVRCEFNTSGELLSLFDKEAARELVKPGTLANVLKCYADYPNQFEAWDVEEFCKNMEVARGRAAASPVVRIGRDFSTIDFSVAVGETRVAMRAVLEKNSKLLRFDCSLDWSESRKLLCASFPVEIFSDSATFDIQYGAIRRPTHSNTSWDAAKFEVVGQRYADLSESDYGVALLNDCKYGYSIRDSVMELSLLRSPKHPDRTADMGRQIFSYAILPHSGEWKNSEVCDEAAAFNRAPEVFGGFAVSAAPRVAFSGSGVTLEAVKKAEKSDDLIVRLVEHSGRRGFGVLKIADSKARVTETNLIEWTDGAALDGKNGEFSLSFRPFEIKTLRIAELVKK